MNPRFRLIIIALVLVASGWALWPTWKYSQVNAEREALVETAESTGTDEAWAALDQWDSTNYDDWLSYRADRIKLGLDLRGGVYFTMEVDVPALLYESADGDLIEGTSGADTHDGAGGDDVVAGGYVLILALVFGMLSGHSG